MRKRRLAMGARNVPPPGLSPQHAEREAAVRAEQARLQAAYKQAGRNRV
jgi:hypothetical protein